MTAMEEGAKHAHGTINLKNQTSSTKQIMDAVMELYDRIVNPNLLIRRIYVVACRLSDESSAKQEDTFEQLDLFTDYGGIRTEKAGRKGKEGKREKTAGAVLSVKRNMGKCHAKGMNLQEGLPVWSGNRRSEGIKHEREKYISGKRNT